MARIIVITGGVRSGKSRYALEVAEGFGGRKLFLATCPAIDEETCERIRRHQAERAEQGWKTVEETVDIASVLSGRSDCDVVVVDCLGLWVNNLMYEAEQGGGRIDEECVAGRVGAVVEAARSRRGAVIFVTSEVGLGIVPENAAARRYRDLVGRCNQLLALAADAVSFVVAGIPLHLKKEGA